MPRQVLIGFEFTLGNPLPHLRSNHEECFSCLSPANSSWDNLNLSSSSGCRRVLASAGHERPPFYGPFNAVFLPDGDGLKKPLAKNDSVLLADSPWSIYAWVKPAEALKLPSLVAGLGDPRKNSQGISR